MTGFLGQRDELGRHHQSACRSDSSASNASPPTGQADRIHDWLIVRARTRSARVPPPARCLDAYDAGGCMKHLRREHRVRGDRLPARLAYTSRLALRRGVRHLWSGKATGERSTLRRRRTRRCRSNGCTGGPMNLACDPLTRHALGAWSYRERLNSCLRAVHGVPTRVHFTGGRQITEQQVAGTVACVLSLKWSRSRNKAACRCVDDVWRNGLVEAIGEQRSDGSSVSGSWDAISR